MEFDYPIDYALYTSEEITIIIKFLDTIEECYLKGVELEAVSYTHLQKA